MILPDRDGDDSNDRVTEILDAAAKVFAERGFDRSSIDDVAAELGATKGRIYHYWRTKAALLLAVQRRGIERMIAHVQPIVADEALTPFERLARMARAHIAAMVADLDYQRVLLQSINVYSQSARSHPHWIDVTEKINALRRDYEQLFVELIRTGQQDGSVAGTDPMLTAKALLGTLNWACVWHQRAADPSRRALRDSRTVHELSEFAIRGLRR